MLKRLLLLSTLSVLLYSCDKNEIKDITVMESKQTWVLDSLFSSESSQLVNSCATDNILYISANDFWLSIQKNSNIYDATSKNFLYGKTYLKKFPITKKLFAYYSDTLFTIKSTAYPLDNYSPNFIVSKIDAEATTYKSEIPWKNEYLAISESMHCLVPTQTKDFYPACYIIKPNYNIDYQNLIHVDFNTSKAKIKKVVINSDNQSAIINLYSEYNKFFVSCSNSFEPTLNKFYSIDTLGNVKMLLNEKIYQVINKSDSLFAFGYPDIVYLSTNKGGSWSEFGVFPKEANAGDLKLVVIDNKIIAYPQRNIGSLYKIELTKNIFSIDTIPTDILRKKDITSIAEFNGKVYVTTLSGLYKKDISKLTKK
jgi:hypothetical protein